MNETTVANLVAKLSLDTSGFTSSASSINANSVQKSIQGAVNDIDIDIKHMTLTGEVEDLKEVNAQYDIMLDAMDGVQNFSKKVTDEIGNWVSVARDVETAWVGVTKSVSAPEGVDADAYFKDLKNEVYQLSTEMPVTFQEIAAAMASAGANGISTENLLSFTEAMLQFESATNGAVTANDAATMFATINTLAQSSEENIGNMASAIVELGNHFGTPEKKVLNMSLAIASLGSNIGLTDDQIVGWSAAITRTGGSAQKSGRAFRIFANQMKDAVKETNADLDVFAKTAANASEEFADMTSEDFAELFKNNASEAMQAFIEGLDPENLSEVFKALNINDSTEQILLTNLANSADKTDLALAMASGAYQSNTALATEAEAANQTLDAQMEMFQNTITAIQAQLGETLLPVIKDIGEALLPILQDVSQFIADHPGLAATIGGVAFALEGVSIAAQLAIAAMAMGIPLSPWMGVAAAIVGVIALLALLSTSLDEIQQKASETAEEIANMDPAKEMVIENRLGEFEVIEFQYDLVPVFDESLGDYIEKEARWDEHAFNPLTGTYEGYYITKEQDEARATIEQTTAAIEEQNAALTATADTIAQNSIGEQMTEDAAKQKTALEQAQDIMNQLTQSQNDLTETTAQTGTAIDETLTNSMDQLNTLLESQAFQQFANQPVSEEVSQSWTLFGENMDKVTSGFESMQGIEFKTPPAISSEVIESYQALADAIWDMNAALTGNSIQTAFDLLGDIGGSALQLVQDAWANIKKEFESWANDNPAIQAVKSFVDGVIGFFQNLFDELVGHSIVPDLIQSVIDCFSGWWEKISGSVQAVKDGIIGFFNDISSNVNTVVENVKQGVLDIWDGAKKTASNVWHWATDWITGGNKGEENQETDESLGSIDMPANMITLDYSDLQPISSEVIESYQALADAIWDMNAALTGQSKDSIEEGMTGVGQGTEEGPVGLSTILSELPDKFSQNQTAAQALADYLTGDFITAINALKKQLAIVETDEKTGEQNASGGNTLYNTLGVVKIVLEDIYSISIINFSISSIVKDCCLTSLRFSHNF